MKKLLIFDVDGTTLDTLDTIVHFVNLTMKDLGLDRFDKEEIVNSIGYSSDYLIKSALDLRGYEYYEEKLKNALDIYHRHYQADVTHLTKPYEGIEDLLVELKQKGYLLGAVSNKPEHTLSIVFKELDFAKYFDYSIGQIDNIPKKPEPNMIYMLKDKFEIDEEDITIIGDTEVDYHTAMNANVEFIAVTWGFRSKDQLLTLNPKHIVDSVDQLRDLIDRQVII